MRMMKQGVWLLMDLAIEKAPKLPGYGLTWSASGPCVATDADGKRWVIGRGVLYPWKVCPPQGIAGTKLKPGEHYLEKEGAIPFPV